MPAVDSARLDPRIEASSTRRRARVDLAARWVVGAGGLATIASILAMFFFIGFEVYPLTRGASVDGAPPLDPPDASELLSVTTDEYRQILYGVSTGGVVRFFGADGALRNELTLEGLEGQRFVASSQRGDQMLLGTANGEVALVQASFETRRGDSTRTRVPRLNTHGRWPLFEGQAVRYLAAAVAGDAGTTLVASSGAAPVLLAVARTENLFGDVQLTETRRVLPLRTESTVSALAVTASGKRAFVGTADGWVQYWDISDKEEPRLVDAVHASGRRDHAITALAVLIGDTSLVVGDDAGHVTVWFPVRDAVQESGWRLQEVHNFTPHRAAVTVIAPSPRDKGFLTGDASGAIALRHATTAQTLLEVDAGEPLRSLNFAPKANGAVAALASGRLRTWEIHNPHPEISWQGLFGKVWYEGYEEPAYVWQSTGGTDDFEPKLSLVPLIIGTLKGTFYALLFAIPIAVLAALYTSQFMHPGLRGVVKPVVEIMAALPSVVLGFLAGLWLAPMLEDLVPAVLAMAVCLPLATFLFGAAWQTLPASWRGRWRDGSELVLLTILLVVGAQLCLAANGAIENLVFGGDFRSWLWQEAGLRFDQRNCLVVGFAMGFAVIPIIFTISEDALSNVPQRLTSASLALGATRWQTALRIVLPTASPGIFSAIMVGFGRAIGETMIVLMATGNTPVLDFNLFSGMRTLSANIAVEIPEAPHGSTLYRVLFLAAMMLFLATFALNTVAEVVRQRLRRKYQQI